MQFIPSVNQATGPCVRKALRSMNASKNKFDLLEALALKLIASDEVVADEDARQRKRKRRDNKGGDGDEYEDSEDDAEDDEVEDDVGNLSDGTEADGDRKAVLDPTRLTVFRELYAPFIWTSLTSPQTRLGGADSSEDEDDDALEVELREEDELDEQDMDISKRAEKALWEEMVDDDSTEETDVDGDEAGSSAPPIQSSNSLDKSISSHFPSRKQTSSGRCDKSGEVRNIGPALPNGESKLSRPLRDSRRGKSRFVKSALYIVDSDEDVHD